MTRVAKETLHKTIFELKNFLIERVPKRIHHGGFGSPPISPTEDLKNRPAIEWQDLPWTSSRAHLSCEVLHLEKPRDENFSALDSAFLRTFCRSSCSEANDEDLMASQRSGAYSQLNFSQSGFADSYFSQYTQGSQQLQENEEEDGHRTKLVRGRLL